MVVIEMGALVITLAPYANRRVGLGALSKKVIQVVRAQSGFHVGMASDRTARVDRHADGQRGGRGRRGE